MSLFEDAKKQIEPALKYAEIDGVALSDETWEKLQYPQRSIEASLPVRLDDGTLKIYKAHRVQFNSLLGCYKGGVRYSPNATLDVCEALGLWMTFKCALAKLDLGGAKGAVQVSPRQLSTRELERLSKAYIDAFADFIGENVDSLGPDLNTDERTMSWFYTHYRRIKGGQPLSAFTGKPVALGGLEARKSATGFGAYYVLETLIDNYKDQLGLKFNNKPTIAIQGVGAVGFHLALKAQQNGFNIVGLSNEFGGIYNEDGIDLRTCITSLAHTEQKEWGVEGNKITNDELLTLNVDILAPCAVESVITEKNADQISAKLIIEGANGPVNLAANNILNDKNCVIVPDLLANVGGIITSYLEMVKNKSGVDRRTDEIDAELKMRLSYATNKTMERVLKHKIPMRIGAYALALKRLSAVNDALGTKDYFRKQ